MIGDIWCPVHYSYHCYHCHRQPITSIGPGTRNVNEWLHDLVPKMPAMRDFERLNPPQGTIVHNLCNEIIWVH